MAAQLEMGWRDCVRMVGNPEAIRLDVVANSWNGRGIGREHRSNHRGALCGDIGSEGPGTWTAGCFRVARDSDGAYSRPRQSVNPWRPGRTDFNQRVFRDNFRIADDHGTDPHALRLATWLD